MMTGYLKQNGNLAIAEKRISTTLSLVPPQFITQRKTSTTRAVNLIPYREDYFGHKLLIDENEKHVMYGVTHSAAIDGRSLFVVTTAMPIKSNLIINRNL